MAEMSWATKQWSTACRWSRGAEPAAARGDRAVTGPHAGRGAPGIAACVEHFAANDQETERLRVSAEVDERTLREIYLAGFERVVIEVRPWTVMCSYNRINGTYASPDPWLLTDVLRGEWGCDGMVVSDWGAVDDRVAGSWRVWTWTRRAGSPTERFRGWPGPVSGARAAARGSCSRRAVARVRRRSTVVARTSPGGR
jgi:hypothetical protein